MWRTTVCVILALFLSSHVQAKQDKDQSHKTNRQSTTEQAGLKSGVTFSPAERNLIRAQLLEEKRTIRRQQKPLPPGLQKKMARGRSLPPGWQKKVEPGHSLDYQLYRQGEGLPDILLRRLPPPPVGSEIIRVDEKIIRLDSTTRTILDVFDLVPAR